MSILLSSSGRPETFAAYDPNSGESKLHASHAHEIYEALAVEVRAVGDGLLYKVRRQSVLSQNKADFNLVCWARMG